MSVARHVPFLLAVAAMGASCGDVVPSPSVALASPSPAAVAESPTPTARLVGSPIVPAISPEPSAAGWEPPYDIEYDVEPQLPGTIWFGGLSGPRRLDPILEWPDAGFKYDFPFRFGAFWGEPIGALRIRISLYRVGGGTLDLIWSEVKRVEPDATGYLDDLVPFKGPGTYRLEVTRGSELLAWGVAHLGPKCKVNCSGG